jgi:hypothetical protein
MCVACGAAQQPGGRLRAEVHRVGIDSARFEAAATAHRCGSGHGVVLEAAARGNGLLVWLRFPDSLTPGSYQPLSRADTTIPRGAVTVVRWMQGDVAHGIVLDSGAVTVTPLAGHLTVRAQGSGLEYAGARRASVDAVFEQVVLAAETTGCGASR